MHFVVSNFLDGGSEFSKAESFLWSCYNGGASTFGFGYFGFRIHFVSKRQSVSYMQRDSDPFLVADTRLYTLPCRSVGGSVGRLVGRSVCPSVRHIFEFRAVFA